MSTPRVTRAGCRWSIVVAGPAPPASRFRRSRSSTRQRSRPPSASRSRSAPVKYVESAEAAAAARSAQAGAEDDGEGEGRQARPRSASPAPTPRPASSRSRTATSTPSRFIPTPRAPSIRLYAAVNQVTDIALEAGEKLVSVSAGDTVRWVVGDTSSGEGKEAQVHILVKPIGADLETNLVITTDRRTYHLEMRSSQSTYMASVSWTYPASDAGRAQEAARRGRGCGDSAVADTGVNIEQLRFRYRIEGDAPWKPRQVFDDGAKVYIQFPSGLAQGEAPPLFVIGPDGKPALVNYRVRGTTYIVDRLFAAAELRLGTAPAARRAHRPHRCRLAGTKQ